MKVTLYNFDKHPNSTTLPTGGVELECVVTDPCVIDSPVLKCNTLDIYNYAYIPDFGRYYFITDISRGHSYSYFNLEVDYLATNRTAIKNSTCYIIRCSQSNKQNNTILDTLYPATSKPFIVSAKMNSDKYSGNTEKPRYLVTVSGKHGFDTYVFNSVGFKAFCSALWLDWATIDGMNDMILALNDPNSYIKNVMITNMNIGNFNAETVTSIPVGNVSVTATAGHLVNHKVTASYTLNFSSFEAGVPEISTRPSVKLGATYEIILPGGVSASIPSCYNSVTIEMEGDALTGSAVYSIVTSNGVISRVNSVFAVPYGLTTANTNITGIASSAISTIGSVMTNNYMGIISGIGNGLASLVPKHSDIGGIGSLINNDGSILVIGTYPQYPAEDNTNNGRPCCRYEKLSNYSGYVKCENPQVVAINKKHSIAVNQMLSEGVYIG